MKKRALLTLALGAVLALGSMGASFATEDTEATTFARGNGFALYSTAESVEDLLNLKLTLIDQMIKDGKISEEAGNAYKDAIIERMENCDEVGSNRAGNERLGIGFGRGTGGFGQGLRDGSGFKGMRGMGFGRTAR